MRLSIRLKGTLLGFLKFDWTLFSKALGTCEQPYAQWLTEILPDVPVNERYIKASLFAVVERIQ